MLNLSPELVSGLVYAARMYDTTRFMVLLATWVESMALWTRTCSVTFCVPVSGRAEWQGLSRIGALAYPIVLHFDISTCSSFKELLQLVKKRFTAALSHQNVPFGEIVKTLKPGRRLHRLPFFDVMFNYIRRCTPSHIETGGLSWQLQLLDTGAAESLLSVLIVETQEGDLQAVLKYPRKCFEESSISNLAELFVVRLGKLAEGTAPSEPQPVHKEIYGY
jgi:non-ribosomal peptide synthetase component F